jgi:DNA ligase-1
MDEIKPNLAEDYVLANVKYPVIGEPKIDGVRGLYLRKKLKFTARTLKKHGNLFINQILDNEIYYGLDGEIASGTNLTDPDLCRKTSSNIGRYEGVFYFTWVIFDYITEETINLPYIERLKKATERVNYINSLNLTDAFKLQMTEVTICSNEQELLALDDRYIELGYEGTIIRDPNGIYKSGRSTVKEGGLLRIKRFVQEDAVVLEIIPAMENTNEKKVNELGRSERSSHAANKVPKEMVGMLLCRDVKTGKTIRVGPGKMKHSQRVHLFKHPEEILGETISYKKFSHGEHEAPRFPTYEHTRLKVDIVQ